MTLFQPASCDALQVGQGVAWVRVQVSYTDEGGRENSDFEDSEAERRERAKLQKEIVPAFMSSHEGLDDEVERVLGHRSVAS